jgi:3-phenylpropionate/cinnamic acid dioxygenase small subunit
MSTNSAPTGSDIARFVYDEARLLDAAHYQAWLDLFAADGHYWLPMRAAQTDPLNEQSLVYEDKLLLNIRIERLLSPKAYAQQPAAQCQHVLQAPVVEEADHGANRFRSRTPFLYIELRRNEQVTLVGTAFHTLRLEDGGLRIVEKRVDLLNAGAILPPVFLIP